MRIVIIIILLSIVSSEVAYACLGPQSESRTFLQALPDSAQDKDIVAKVEIIARGEGKQGPLSVVKVIEPLKGVQRGDTLQVISEGHSCAADFFVKPHEVYYIAGTIDSEGYFKGVWKSIGN